MGSKALSSGGCELRIAAAAASETDCEAAAEQQSSTKAGGCEGHTSAASIAIWRSRRAKKDGGRRIVAVLGNSSLGGRK